MKTTSYLKPLAELAVLAGSFCSLAQATTVFNFDNDVPGTVTTFTDTVDGLSATFSTPGSSPVSSPGGPAGYSVQQSFFDLLAGNVLTGPAFRITFR